MLYQKLLASYKTCLNNKAHVKKTKFHLHHESIIHQLALDIENRTYQRAFVDQPFDFSAKAGEAHLDFLHFDRARLVEVEQTLLLRLPSANLPLFDGKGGVAARFVIVFCDRRGSRTL